MPEGQYRSLQIGLFPCTSRAVLKTCSIYVGQQPENSSHESGGQSSGSGKGHGSAEALRIVGAAGVLAQALGQLLFLENDLAGSDVRAGAIRVPAGHQASRYLARGAGEKGEHRLQSLLDAPTRREAAGRDLPDDDVVLNSAQGIESSPGPHALIDQIRGTCRTRAGNTQQFDPVGVRVEILHGVQELAELISCGKHLRGGWIQLRDHPVVLGTDVLSGFLEPATIEVDGIGAGGGASLLARELIADIRKDEGPQDGSDEVRDPGMAVAVAMEIDPEQLPVVAEGSRLPPHPEQTIIFRSLRRSNRWLRSASGKLAH